MVLHKNFTLPHDFFSLPWLRVKRLTTAGEFYLLSVHSSGFKLLNFTTIEANHTQFNVFAETILANGFSRSQ